MAGRRLVRAVLFTGGVAMVPGMGPALSAALGHPVRIAPQPQCTCALGGRAVWPPSGPANFPPAAPECPGRCTMLVQNVR